MASCDLCDRCYFFNERLFDNLLGNAEKLRSEYCTGDHFKECVLHRIAECHGIGKVPKYLFPNDITEFRNFNIAEPEGGLFMFIKVIYPDGTSGMVRASSIDRLIRTGKIIAYHCSDGWVELRRKQYLRYKGPERRELRAY
jgi:hypothetical protein